MCDDADPASQGERIPRSALDQFAQLYSDARRGARVMALVLHPYIMGAPHRLKYVRDALSHFRGHDDVVFWTGEQILNWYVGQKR